MELTAFTCRLGDSQGRLRPGAFVLGDDEPGRFSELALGDFIEVTQSADLTGVTLVKSAMLLRIPKSLPAGFAWEVSIIVDGAKYASLRAKPGRQRAVTDLAANVSKQAGLHVVGVRLDLVPG